MRPQIKLAVPGRSPRLKTRQLWEGTVTEVRSNGFVAVLQDRTNPKNPDEQVALEFDTTEVSPEDLALVKPGFSFYWIIGNELTAARQSKNVSMLQFRRVPAWTEEALAQAKSNAARLKQIFGKEA